MEGWIKLHRRFLEWEWFDIEDMVQLFIYLLLSANHEAQKWRGQTIERGQVLTGRIKLAEKLGKTERRIRTCLSRLESTGELTIKTTSKFSIITLCNYDTYQTEKNQNDQQTDQQPTSKRPASDQQVTTNKNDKNVKNEKNEKKLNSLHAKMREMFQEYYLNLKGIDYYWQAKDGAALRRLITKLKKSTGGEDKIEEAWDIVLQCNNDKWILDHLSVSILDSKYNEIIAQIKKSISGDSTLRNEVQELLNQQ